MSRLFETARGHDGTSELPEGLRMEVLRYNGDLYFVAKLEWAKDGTYQITSEDGSAMPYVEYNSSMKLRGHYKGEAIFVEGVVVGSSAHMWRIAQNRVVRGADQRAFFRQNVKLELVLCCGNELRGDECGENTPQGKLFKGTMLNISAGGTQITTEANFVKTDWISLMDVKLVPEMEPFNLICAIRRKADADGRGKIFVYGCEFVELGAAEQDRLIKAILTLQRKEIRARRGGNGI